jgi:hypothetical protein
MVGVLARLKWQRKKLFYFAEPSPRRMGLLLFEGTNMKLLLIGLASLVLTGCLPNNCPVVVGDRVTSIQTGKSGSVVGIASRGQGAADCKIAVLHDDKTLSYRDSPTGDGWGTTSDYVANWKYSK